MAAEDGAKAQLQQSQAEFDRQADLVKRQVSTQANYDKALAQRDTDKANLEQAQGQHRDSPRSITATRRWRRRSTAS